MRNKLLLDVLDDGLAFERWCGDGHTEECFDAADRLHRVVAAQVSGASLPEELAPTKALLDACPLCRQDLADAVALVREFETTAAAPTFASAGLPFAASRPREKPLHESSVGTMRLVDEANAEESWEPDRIQRAYQPHPTVPRYEPPLTRSERLRSRLATVAIVFGACVAALLFFYQVVDWSGSKAPTKIEHGEKATTGTTAPGFQAPRKATAMTTPAPMRPAPAVHKLAPPTRRVAPGGSPPRVVKRREPAMRRVVSPPRIRDPWAARKPLRRVTPPSRIVDPWAAKAPDKVPDKATGYGYLRINTIPWCKVYVDGRFVGNTPLLKVKLKAGRHRLTLRNDAHKVRVVLRITIQAGKYTTIVRRLR